MEGLARIVIRRRKIVIVLWLALTVFGAYSAMRVSDRWLERFSIPGYSAY
jgi:predicted RND superfamily exporter protein